MKFTWFIGIDVSKATREVAFCHQDNPNQFTHQQFANNLCGFQGLLKGLNKQKLTSRDSLFCMQHTGHYTLALCCFLQDPHWAYTLVSALHLKKSLGITRGKNDRIDAQRISFH